MKAISLNRNQIKYLVIAAMLIDHIAWAFVPMNSILGQAMHFIGRLTGPTMAYFLVEGYLHTRSVKKYARRLGIFSLVSWAPFTFFEFGVPPIILLKGDLTARLGGISFYLQSLDLSFAVYPFFGVIYTLFLSLLAVWLWDKGHCPKWCKILGIFGLCILSFLGDWPVFDILFALFFFVYRDQPKKKWIAFCITAMAVFLINGLSFTTLFQFGMFMVPFLIHFCYNGEGGSKKPIHKWFFYLFYPVHLLILGLL